MPLKDYVIIIKKDRWGNTSVHRRRSRTTILLSTMSYLVCNSGEGPELLKFQIKRPTKKKPGIILDFAV